MTRARDKASAVVANFASTGIDDNADANAITIDSSERVGMGTTAPNSSLQVSKTQSALSGTSNQYGVHIYPTSSGATFVDGITAGSGGAGITMRSYYNGTYNDVISGTTDTNTTTFETGGTERFRITANGVTFNGDTAAANALDDYEEGTWTPVSGAITLSSSAGKYTKIGNLVSISWLIEFPSTSNSGSAIISGLPFNVAATQYSGATAITNFGSSNILPMVNYGDNTITFRTYSNTTYTNANMSSKFHYGWAVYST